MTLKTEIINRLAKDRPTLMKICLAVNIREDTLTAQLRKGSKQLLLYPVLNTIAESYGLSIPDLLDTKAVPSIETTH